MCMAVLSVYHLCVHAGIGAVRPALKQEQPAPDNNDDDAELNAALRQKSQQRRERKHEAAGKLCCTLLAAHAIIAEKAWCTLPPLDNAGSL